MNTRQSKTKPDLSYLHIQSDATLKYQLSVPELVEEAIQREEGSIADKGAVAADTGTFTGRSPKDRFIVKDATTENAVWWNNINQPIAPTVFEGLFEKVGKYLSQRTLFVRDVAAGADEQHQIGIRVITETAYQNMFANNMFIRKSEVDPEQRPDWSILAAPGFFADPQTDGVPNKNFVLVNFTKKIILIGGTGYTGEIKKGIFSVLNFILPHQKKVLSMHCSANMDQQGETALFFGLSGTGKTTLSSDGGRHLIGDDEHGWDDHGIFNFEGGCYAKCVNLEAEKEPEIFNAVRFGALLENINYYPGTRTPDYSNIEKTENTRVAYPIDHIQGSEPSGKGSSPKNIFFLTCDAFGVIPPISRLTVEQAMYHFISGYTAKVAGTEVGITEPKTVFSACFGEAFIPLHPGKYADLLGEKLKSGNINVWLVNTGWIAGPYGIGRRIKLSYTRSLVRAALSGELNDGVYKTHDIFGLKYPTACPGVPEAILDPIQTWEDKEAYEAHAKKLAHAFAENFKSYESGVQPEIVAAGPKVSAVAAS